MNTEKIKLSLKFSVPAALAVIAVVVIFSIKMQIKTIEVHYGPVEDRIEFSGIYFVEESVVYTGKTDKIKLNFKNGTKLSKGAIIGGDMAAPEAGILVVGLDGYENKYNITNIKDINSKDIQKLIDKRPKLPGIKILNNSQWFLCLSIPKEYEEMLRKGNEKEIRIGEKYYITQVADKFKNDSGYFVVLKMKDDLDVNNLLRGITGYIIKARVNGISLPTTSIAQVGETKGVFVEENGYAYFKKVKIVADNKDSVIVTSDVSSNSGLKEYDKVIVNCSGIKNGDKIR